MCIYTRWYLLDEVGCRRRLSHAVWWTVAKKACLYKPSRELRNELGDAQFPPVPTLSTASRAYLFLFNPQKWRKSTWRAFLPRRILELLTRYRDYVYLRIRRNAGICATRVPVLVYILIRPRRCAREGAGEVWARFFPFASYCLPFSCTSKSIIITRRDENVNSSNAAW